MVTAHYSAKLTVFTENWASSVISVVSEELIDENSCVISGSSPGQPSIASLTSDI